MARVSAVIPLHNSQRYIRETIKSVLAQSYSDLETIVVDDGSTDGSPAIVASFGQAVRYVRQENSGAARARNQGVAIYKGEYIAFLDSDDVWLSDKIKKQ